MAWYDLITGKLVEGHPPDEALDLLDDAKATLPPGNRRQARGWTDGEDEDGEWAVKSEYLGTRSCIWVDSSSCRHPLESGTTTSP